MFLGLRHTNSKKENRLLKANINYKGSRHKKRNNDREGKLETNLRDKDKRGRQGEVWILEKITMAMSQHSFLKSRERTTYYPKLHCQGCQP